MGLENQRKSGGNPLRSGKGKGVKVAGQWVFLSGIFRGAEDSEAGRDADASGFCGR